MTRMMQDTELSRCLHFPALNLVPLSQLGGHIPDKMLSLGAAPDATAHLSNQLPIHDEVCTAELVNKKRPSDAILNPSLAHIGGWGRVKCLDRGAEFPRTTKRKFVALSSFSQRLPTIGSKHRRTKHDRPTCYPVGCTTQLLGFNKDMYRHVRAAHSTYASKSENGIPLERGAYPFPACENVFTRQDSLKRHIDEQHNNEKRCTGDGRKGGLIHCAIRRK